MLQSQNELIIGGTAPELNFDDRASSQLKSKENRSCTLEAVVVVVDDHGDMPLSNGCISGRSLTDQLGRSDLFSQSMEPKTDDSRTLTQEIGFNDDDKMKQKLVSSHSIDDHPCEENSSDCELSQCTLRNDILSSDKEQTDGIISEVNNCLSDNELQANDAKDKKNGSFCVEDDNEAVNDSECPLAPGSQPDGPLSVSLSPSERTDEEEIPNIVSQEMNGSIDDLSQKDRVCSRESSSKENDSTKQYGNRLPSVLVIEDNSHCDKNDVAVDCKSCEDSSHKDMKDKGITLEIRETEDVTQDSRNQSNHDDSQITELQKNQLSSDVSTADSSISIKIDETDDQNSQGTSISFASDKCNDVVTCTGISETVENVISVVPQCDISESELQNKLTGDQVMDSILIDDEEGDGVMMRRKEQRPNSIRLSAMSLSQGLSGSNTPVGRMSNFGNIGDEIDLDETQFVEINLQSCNSDSKSSVANRSVSSAETSSLSSFSSKTSRLGNFLARNFSLKKSRDRDDEDAAAENLGWKLFGRVAPRETTQAGVPEVVNEYRSKVNSKPTYERDVVRRSSREVPSTTALILQPRPRDLPSKNPEEELKHKLMYEEMVEAARKSEQREAKLRKKQREEQIRHEEELSAAVRTWNLEILPYWETTRMSRKTQDLWWKGIPPSIRGKVWKLAIGNDLNVTSELYEICLVRAREKLKILRDVAAGSDTDSLSSFSTELTSNRESSVDLIQLDVSRTFPQLCIFQAGGPYHKLLQGLLGAYVCYRPDVGYVQGMSFLAAVLLLNMDDVSSFICFANLLNKPCELAFFRLDENLMKAYFDTYQIFFKENLPKLYVHFENQRITPDLYIIDWMYTLFAKSLPLDVASRVWDVFCRDGEEFLFRTALGILKLYENILFRLDFIHLAQFLTRLPETVSSSELFQCIGQIRMQVNKCSFAQVFAKNQPL